MNIKYPLYNLYDEEFESLVSLICQKILGIGTFVFSVGKDGGKDAKFTGTAEKFPSKASPLNGKFIIQAKHTTKPVASCSDSEFETILKKECISIRDLKNAGKIDYYLLFTNRKLSGLQDSKIEDFIYETTGVTNFVIGDEIIQLWLKEHPEIAKILNLNRLFLSIEFYEKDLQDIVVAFSEVKFSTGELAATKDTLRRIPIEEKNALNKLSKDYFDEIFKKSYSDFSRISLFFEDPLNYKYKLNYEKTVKDIQEEIILNKDNYVLFDQVLSDLYKKTLDMNNGKLLQNRSLLRVFLHYMYYNCDIGRNGGA
jgi:hypothetical protein